MTFEEARKAGPVYVIGCDPGPEKSAFACVKFFAGGRPLTELSAAYYISNLDLSDSRASAFIMHGLLRYVPGPVLAPAPVFLSYETCGNQGRQAGAGTFETAAMGGEIRRAFRPYVAGTYAFSPSDWRYALVGRGNAKTPDIYAEFGGFFVSSVVCADPLKGTKDEPGPLRRLHEAGKGGNMEHMKDALGVALALDRVRYRSARDPEEFRRPW